MAETPDADQERIRHEALRQELEVARRRRDSYQALIKDLPDIFEGKFRERLRPLQQRNEQLQLEGMALRKQIRRVLPQASGPPAEAPSLQGPSERDGNPAHPQAPAAPAGAEDGGSLSERIAAPLDRLAGPGHPASGGAGFDQPAASANFELIPPAPLRKGAFAADPPADPATAAMVSPATDPRASAENAWQPFVLPFEALPADPIPFAPSRPATGSDGNEHEWPDPMPRTRARHATRNSPSTGRARTLPWPDDLRMIGAQRRRRLWLLAAAAAFGVVLMLPLTRHLPKGRPALVNNRAVMTKVQASAPVVLRSVEPSWLEVQNGDGETLYYDILRGSRSFPISRGLRLRAGRPDLIRIRFPGQKERRLGTVYEVDWHALPAATANP